LNAVFGDNIGHVFSFFKKRRYAPILNQIQSVR